MAEHNELGSEGETIAMQHLLSKGYTILDMNWRYGHKEIDIIAHKDSELVVVEVKTRKGDFDSPLNSVNRAKQRFIIQAANAYVRKKDIDDDVRFDIVSIVFYRKGYKLEHIEDAFYPMMNLR